MLIETALTLAAALGPAPPAAAAEQPRARIVYLGHSGWAVSTRSRLLVFDYVPGETAFDPAELRDRSVVVFVSHAHGDHWDPRLLDWRDALPDATFVFGWPAGLGPEHVYCGPGRQERTLGALKVRTIVHDFDGIPESAFLVEVDGLTIFHAGDHGNGPPPYRAAFEDNLRHVAAIAPRIDLAFIPTWGEEAHVVRVLRPRFTFPMHGRGREQAYAEFAERAAREGLPTEVVAARAPGDRFELTSDERLVRVESAPAR